MTQVQAEMERFRRDASYYEEHREELLKKYPDRWVAIYDERVVATAKDLNRLITQLQKKGIPQGRAFVEYVTEKEDLLILFDYSLHIANKAAASVQPGDSQLVR